MPRPPGAPNKRSMQLLTELTEKHDFHIIPKIVSLYNRTEKLYQPLFLKVEANMIAGVAVETGLTEAEMTLFGEVRKDLWTILAALLGYCYPKLKALDIGAGTADSVIFNINVPKTDAKGNFAVALGKVCLDSEPTEEDTAH